MALAKVGNMRAMRIAIIAITNKISRRDTPLSRRLRFTGGTIIGAWGYMQSWVVQASSMTAGYFALCVKLERRSWGVPFAVCRRPRG